MRGWEMHVRCLPITAVYIYLIFHDAEECALYLAFNLKTPISTGCKCFCSHSARHGILSYNVLCLYKCAAILNLSAICQIRDPSSNSNGILYHDMNLGLTVQCKTGTGKTSLVMCLIVPKFQVQFGFTKYEDLERKNPVINVGFLN